MDQSQKKKRLLRVFLALFFTAAIIAVITAVRGDGFQSFWKRLTGARLASDFYYENCSGGAFATVGDGFAACSNGGLYLFDGDANPIFTRLYNYSAVQMCAAGAYGAVYDLGGTSAIFFNEEKVIRSVETELPIISVSVNEDGYFAVSAQENLYQGAVTVYNRNGTDIYKWYSGTAHVLSADVLPSRKLLALTVGEGGSSLILYSLSGTEPEAQYSYAGLAIDAVPCGDALALVTTASVIWLDGDLRETGTYAFAGRYLAGYAAGADFLTLALSDFQVGGVGTLVSVDAGGKELGSIAAPDDVLDLDAVSDKTAVLYQNSLAVYDRKLRLIYRVDGVAGAERAVLTERGDVAAAAAFSAHTYTQSDGTTSGGVSDKTAD